MTLILKLIKLNFRYWNKSHQVIIYFVEYSQFVCNIYTYRNHEQLGPAEMLRKSIAKPLDECDVNEELINVPRTGFTVAAQAKSTRYAWRRNCSRGRSRASRCLWLRGNRECNRLPMLRSASIIRSFVHQFGIGDLWIPQTIFIP